MQVEPYLHRIGTLNYILILFLIQNVFEIQYVWHKVFKLLLI